MTPATTLAPATAPCADVAAGDGVVVAGGRHAGRPGVLVRSAATHQRHHVVRLAGGAITRVSTAYVHHSGCPVVSTGWIRCNRPR